MGGSRLPSLAANSGWIGSAALANLSALRRNPGPLMPEPSPLCEREFLPSANQALADLEEATGKPVMVMEAPELGVLATIRRAGPEEASHLLRIKSGGNRLADYLIVFECRMALRDGPGPQPVVKARRPVREQVIRECERLQQQLPLAKARELGNFLYDGLILQLRSMGPGIGVDRWIREHCPDLRDPQQQAMEAEISNNLGGLKASTRANYPAAIVEASLAMNAAYAIHGGDLLGKPYLAVPYISQGYGDRGRRLVGLALGEGNPAHGPTDRQIIDGWAQELGIADWYEWSELSA